MFPPASMSPAGKILALFEPNVAVPGIGAGVVGESNTPLKTGWFWTSVTGAAALIGGAQSASQTLSSFPNGGWLMLFRGTEPLKRANPRCVILFTKTGPGFVFGNVVVKGSNNSGLVMPAVDCQTPSLTRLEMRIASELSSSSQ